jgi:hypothetical protein
VEAWRRLSPDQRLQLVADTSSAVIDLSVAGVRRRYPEASERECFLRAAALRIGVEATRRIYPDASELADLRGPA